METAIKERGRLARTALLLARAACALSVIAFAVVLMGPVGTFLLTLAVTAMLFRRHPEIVQHSHLLLVPLILWVWPIAAAAGYYQRWPGRQTDVVLVAALLGFTAGLAAWSYRERLSALAERLARRR